MVMRDFEILLLPADRRFGFDLCSARRAVILELWVLHRLSPTLPYPARHFDKYR